MDTTIVFMENVRVQSSHAKKGSGVQEFCFTPVTRKILSLEVDKIS